MIDAMDHHRIEREETEPVLFERTRRRRMVTMFIRERRYWKLLEWLRDPLAPKFLSLSEAVAHHRTTGDTMRLVVARYFLRSRWHWLDDPK